MALFFKSTVSLLASVVLLSASLVNGRAVEAVELVERTAVPLEQRSSFKMVHIDPETHELVHGPPVGFSKRHFDEHHLLDILRHHEPQKFCKSYCPSEYSPSGPLTVYVTKTKLVTKSKTTTTTGKGGITTKVVQGSPSVASTVTKTSTIVSLTTLTVNAPSQTIDVQETLTISEAVTLTTELPEQITTSFDVITSTIVITESGPDTTIIVGAAPSMVAPRHNQDPSWLAGYSRSQIVNACKQLVPPPHLQTVTHTAYKTVTTRKVVKTCKFPGKLSTKTTTIHAPASTVTKTDSQILISTIQTTATPLTTKTITTQYTTLVTIIETSTPPTQTKIETSFVSTTTTATVPGATHTACANQVNMLSGGGVNDTRGTLNPIQASSSIDCCSKCFDRNDCTGWEYFSGGCYIGRENIGGSPETATLSCPNGKGAWVLFANSNSGTGVGGPGPCTGEFLVQRN